MVYCDSGYDLPPGVLGPQTLRRTVQVRLGSEFLRLQVHLHCLVTSIHDICGLEGDVAQLGERSVRNAEVVGSNPIVSTNEW